MNTIYLSGAVFGFFVSITTVMLVFTGAVILYFLVGRFSEWINNLFQDVDKDMPPHCFDCNRTDCGGCTLNSRGGK